MSKLEELIQEFCPNGVEYKRLSEFTKLLRGKRLTKSQLIENGKYAVYHGSLVPLGYYNEANRDSGVIIVNTGGIGGVGYSDTPFWCSDGCFCLDHSSKMVDKYVYYALVGFKDYLISRTRVGGVPTIDSDTVLSIKIPLPALPVQREIVRILDSFTLYSAELTAEFTARRKQYEFYRDKLLNFDSGNIQRVKLKDICGKVSNIKWQNDDNEYAYIDLSSVDRETHKITIEQRINKENAPSRAQQIVNKGDILFATTRPTLKRYCKITEEFNGQICSTGFVVLRPKINIILSTYLYYIVSSDRFFTYVEKNQEGTSYPAISDSKVKEFDFSLPPMEVQERIVKVLDNFDAICSDLGIGLPAEIEKRQKQYEYYREKLLTFDNRFATILDRQTDRQTDRAD